MIGREAGAVLGNKRCQCMRKKILWISLKNKSDHYWTSKKRILNTAPKSGPQSIFSIPPQKKLFSRGFYIRWLLISRFARMTWKRSFSEKKIEFDDSFDVTKCLQQIEMAELLPVCAWWNEQPSIIKTMFYRFPRFVII